MCYCNKYYYFAELDSKTELCTDIYILNYSVLLEIFHITFMSLGSKYVSQNRCMYNECSSTYYHHGER